MDGGDRAHQRGVAEPVRTAPGHTRGVSGEDLGKRTVRRVLHCRGGRRTPAFRALRVPPRSSDGDPGTRGAIELGTGFDYRRVCISTSYLRGWEYGGVPDEDAGL